MANSPWGGLLGMTGRTPEQRERDKKESANARTTCLTCSRQRNQHVRTRHIAKIY